MENFLRYLPLVMCSSSSSKNKCYWPPKAEKILKQLQLQERPLQSGHDLVSAISSLRKALSSKPLPKSASGGFVFLFDKSMSSEESSKWFNEVVPALAKLLLKLPSLLEAHYKDANMDIHGEGAKVTTALRMLEPLQPGVVCLSQELIAALLGCSLFCLFPVHERPAKNFPMINFDKLFEDLFRHHYITQKNKIWCILHYFERISSDMPKGIVSFERRVLLNDANFWSNSAIPLCKFEVHSSGHIEDQSSKAVEVYFAGKIFGGNALGNGTLQGELRFMFSPELIAGMLFLPAMKDNEAIEIVGVERFSTYTRHESSFRYSDVYMDKRDVDTLGRRKTRIVVVDELCIPKMRECTADIFLSEINKSFCGFMYHGMDQGNSIGVATGDWVFKKDAEIKPIIHWLAASQAQRPFIAYWTSGVKELQNLGEVALWISSQSWTVGFLWNMLIKYSADRSKGDGFFQWLRLTYGHTCRSSQEEAPFAACEVCERERVLSRMENFLTYLPQVSSLSWPPEAVEILKKLEEGLLQSGEELFNVICDLREALCLSSEPLSKSASGGFAFFFDNVMSSEESRKWFNEVVPALAKLLLNLPFLLEAHYKNANMDISGEGAMVTTALRILESQEPGVVCLSQELIAALLGCSLFCLFPVID